ncbi:class E sortase [Corynebacterium sp. H128]|uniref:class E sortase n=1 Tax=unclassified Corynebacterium TaxID=2624378 RepID=UPI0030A02875
MNAARHSGSTTATSTQRKVSAVQVVGELFITISLLLFSFAFYEAYWTNVEAGKNQDAAAQQLESEWKKNPREKKVPELGEAFARMYIPAFGSDFQFAIVEGTSDADLLTGPGHYEESQLPGEPGNFAVAGHRVGKGAPFNDLGQLQECDAIVVETRTDWHIYRVLPIDASGATRRAEAASCFDQQHVAELSEGRYQGVAGRHITVPGDYAVVQPVPGQDTAASAPGVGSLMTMTTCHPQFSNAERMIVHAMLVRSEPKTGDNRPAEFKEG